MREPAGQQQGQQQTGGTGPRDKADLLFQKRAIDRALQILGRVHHEITDGAPQVVLERRARVAGAGHGAREQVVLDVQQTQPLGEPVGGSGDRRRWRRGQRVVLQERCLRSGEQRATARSQVELIGLNVGEWAAQRAPQRRVVLDGFPAVVLLVDALQPIRQPIHASQLDLGHVGPESALQAQPRKADEQRHHDCKQYGEGYKSFALE